MVCLVIFYISLLVLFNMLCFLGFYKVVIGEKIVDVVKFGMFDFKVCLFFFLCFFCGIC